MKASVIVCSHNSRADHLRRCLLALREQSVSKQTWELLIVDNRCDQPLEGRIDLNWHPLARVIREETLGLTAARLEAIRRSQADLLVFVDDDNVLDADFLETALRVAAQKPFLGSWSGQCRAEFEQPPPEWTRRYWGNLVIREFDRDVWSNLPRLAESMPCGAGLCVRREVAQRYLELHETGQRRLHLDRRGDSLLSAGDNDLAACACDLGLGVALISALRLTHLIPEERVTADYLERLLHGIYFSSTLLDAARGLPVRRRGAIGAAADFLRLVRARPPHRRILKSAYDGRRAALDLLAAAETCH